MIGKVEIGFSLSENHQIVFLIGSSFSISISYFLPRSTNRCRCASLSSYISYLIFKAGCYIYSALSFYLLLSYFLLQSTKGYHYTRTDYIGHNLFIFLLKNVLIQDIDLLYFSVKVNISGGERKQVGRYAALYL
jgi:hypothetical protein